MSNTSVVDVSELIEIKKRLDEINQLNFKDIQWTMNNKNIQIFEDFVDEWHCIGLSNVSFVMMDFYSNPEVVANLNEVKNG